jgi:toxin secretion/phage lysis holin
MIKLMKKRWKMEGFVKGAGAWCAGVVVYFIGGFDLFLEALLVCMLVDYIMGLTVAGLYQRSEKTDTGGLNSFVGWMGISKKITSLLFVIIGVELQKMTGIAGIREGIIVALVLNELISIIENAGLMGVPVPKPLTDVIDVLKAKEKTNE